GTAVRRARFGHGRGRRARPSRLAGDRRNSTRRRPHRDDDRPADRSHGPEEYPVIRRFLGGLVTLWAFGFLWFALFLPQPLEPAPSDAVIVPTGGAGRIERGLELLRLKQSSHLLVSGVDPEVRPREFATEYKV